MASYTFTTNAEEEAALQRELSRRNVHRAESIPPEGALRMDDLLFNGTRTIVKAILAQARKDEEAEIAELVRVANPEQRKAVLKALGH